MLADRVSAGGAISPHVLVEIRGHSEARPRLRSPVGGKGRAPFRGGGTNQMTLQALVCGIVVACP